MENPIEDIKSVVQQLTATDSPDIQKAAFESYMTPDVAFRHPVCAVSAGPNSRATVLGIYQWYRVLSPRIEIKLDSIVFDTHMNVMYVEGEQKFKLFFLPIRPVPARLIIRLTLRKHDGLYYISEQEDFYHPDDFAALLLPASAPFVRLGLAVGATVSSVLARTAGLFGFWAPRSAVHESAHQAPSEAASDAGLYKDD